LLDFCIPISETLGMANIQFLGAAGTVTGSKYLVDTGQTRFLIDCGMFQGLKKLRLLNWGKLPVVPSTIQHVIITHAHIDHSGMLPVLVRDGFQGPIWSTPATRELCEISLEDAAHLQEEDARFANKKGFSKHSVALPLFNLEDAQRAIGHLRSVPYEEELVLPGEIKIHFRDAGHILGSAIVEAAFPAEGRPLRIVFSGDLGRYNALILRDPEPIQEADYLLVESTYGNRLHAAEETTSEMAEVINETARRGGTIVIPSFAVGRTQTILYVLRELKAKKLIPDLPVYVDSPMAIEVTDLFCRHTGDFDEDAKKILRETGQCPILCPNLHFVRNQTLSKQLNESRFPAIIISASGMATGGRILHHLKMRLPDARNTILFVGYQASGTRGQLLRDGAKEIKIHGEMVPVRAQIHTMESFSGHADAAEILRWLKTFRKPPKMTFVVHGEPEASAALAESIQKTLNWKTHIPDYLETAQLI
jgi:metallo-beta-lactamase family protein